MSKQNIDVDTIISLLERYKDVIDSQLESAGESASIQLDVKVSTPLPVVNGEGRSGVSHLQQPWSLDVIVKKDNKYHDSYHVIATPRW